MRSFAVASGKGGVGKTMLSANFACYLAIEGHKVLVFDADLGLANLDIALGLNPTKSLKHVVRDGAPLREVLLEGPGGMHIIPGGSGISELANLGHTRLDAILQELQSLALEYDFVIFDVAAGVDSNVVSFMAAADETCLVCTPEPSSMIDAYAAIKALHAVRPSADVAVVINMCDNHRHGVLVFERLKMITGQFLNQELRFAGSVRRDENALMCARQRQCVVLAHPMADAAKDIESTAQRLFLGRQVPLRDSNFVDRLRAAFTFRKAS